MIPLLCSCYKDKGNYDYNDIEKIIIEGIDPSYQLITALDTIKVNPQVSSNIPNAQFEFNWMVFENNVQGALPKNDTIARTQALNYRVDMKAANYTLVLSAKNLATGVTQYKTAQFQVTTQFSTGWYVAKSINGMSDMDLHLTIPSDKIMPTGKVSENIFSTINKKQLKGTNGKLCFFDKYRILGSDGFFSPSKVLVLATGEDISVINQTSMTEVYDFNKLFYAAPQNCNPTAMFYSGMAFYLLNDQQAHSLASFNQSTGQHTFPHKKDWNNTPVKLSAQYLNHVVSDPLFFDELSCSFVSTTANLEVMKTITDSKETHMPSMNNNKELLFMAPYSDFPYSGCAIFRDKTNNQLKILSKMDNLSWNNFMIKNDTLSENDQLYHATAYGTNFKDERLIYFAVNDQIWSRNLENKQERLQFTAPAGETITYIKHKRGNNTRVNHVVVATQKGDLYIARFFKKRSGNLMETPQLTLEGKGVFSDVQYMDASITAETFPF